MNISALAKITLMKEIAVDSSMKKLSIEALTGCAESPLASFLQVSSLGGRGFVVVLPTIVFNTSAVG